METLWNMYLNLTIRVRIIILCACYSFCIIAAGAAGQFLSPPATSLAVILFTILGALFSGINIWSITSSINRTIDYLKEMATGDLQRDIRIKHNNEVSAILRSLRELQQSVREIVTGIQTTSGQVAASSERLRQTSASIADGTESAAAQAASVSTAVDDLAAMSADISTRCLEMSDMAREAEQVSREGERIISGMSGTMGAIEGVITETTEAVKSLGDNSTRIGDILATIGDIADQTNLLALNAAIEAARAGEQGRGFAVVADEVRSLAERTTAATREIQTIIDALQRDVRNVVSSMEQSSGSVHEGGEGVRHSCEAIGTILRQIGVLHGQVSQVSTAATGQSTTTSAITGNMHLITRVISEAASGAEQTEAAASSLATSATELQQMVNRFKLS
ncbi:methyl-accepting chemotaxis protein [Geobacter sp. FeAm09]|uniref:methyl-accepting chemotaxis protein n=1 Tax=Geobacter sp. FeAm09 TaxID=2597769 RepID=UPI0011EC2A43|nr:methyl-accepting chemotaxis protein [Geobacter sp. FeAm09]QEM69621.1 methyl-accepting chemotaxis protein [Geobacter sp. FeAm09]